jgi:Mg-chelatase subunit ChlD
LAAQQKALKELLESVPQDLAPSYALTFFSGRSLTIRSDFLTDGKQAGFHPSNINWRFLRTQTNPSETNIGGAIDFARGLLPAGSSRGIVLITDGRDTEKQAERAVVEARVAGFHLALKPAADAVITDIRVASVHMPDSVRLGRNAPIAVTIAGEPGRKATVQLIPFDRGAVIPPITVEISKDGVPLKTVRFFDEPLQAGTAVYLARVTPADGLPDRFPENNEMRIAIPVIAPSRWAVLTRPGSTLAAWAQQAEQMLGIELVAHQTPTLPKDVAAYADCTGIMIDGLSAKEMPPNGPEIRAVAEAISRGLGLIAVGGPAAFGAGGHPLNGAWESLLPATFQPEDDRATLVLFLIDVSFSMELSMPGGERKLDFAKTALAHVVRERLDPSAHIALIAFSGTAKTILPPETDRSRFVRALEELKLVRETDFRPALKEAERLLSANDAERRVIVLLSDGEQTVGDVRTVENELREFVQKLCSSSDSNQRTVLHAFGIGVESGGAAEAGEKFMRTLAATGGGRFFDDLRKLPENLVLALNENNRELYARRDVFALVAERAHPLLTSVGENDGPWPLLPFRNRVKERPTAETLLRSALPQTALKGPKIGPDPLLILGHIGESCARTALLALDLDGESGAAFLRSGRVRPLLAALAAWAEKREGLAPPGWALATDVVAGKLFVRVQRFNVTDNSPVTNETLTLKTVPVRTTGDAPEAATATPMRQTAPGQYEATIAAKQAGLLRLEITGSAIAERLIAMPYPEEYTAFGVDEDALRRLKELAGERGAILRQPRDFANWLKTFEPELKFESLRTQSAFAALLFLTASFLFSGAGAQRAQPKAGGV